MLGELLDSAVSVLSPSWAAKRAYARGVYKKFSRRAFDAARVDRTTSSWTTFNQSADRAMLGEADRVRQRARDLVRNNAYARGALDAIVANVVGQGVKPRPATDDPARNDKILSAWNRWCETADISGRLHFYEMQSLALREEIEAGECLIHYTNDNDPLKVCPLSLELVEADRISSDTDTFSGLRRKSEGNEIRRGVELNKKGRAEAYWLYPQHPDGTGYSFSDAERIMARDLLHLYRQERIGQTRGISWLAPAVIWLRDLGLYVDNELQASAVAACFSVVVKTFDSGASFGGLATPDDEKSTDSTGNRFERVQPGLVSHLMPGEDISVINPSRPNATADQWISLILRSIAVAMGVSYELVSRDYSRTNYSSNRASALEDRRRFRPMQDCLVWHLCQPVYREFFSSCVRAEVEGFPTAQEFIQDPAPWLQVTWRTQGWEWVDPMKEAQAAKLEVEFGFRSRGDVIEGSGGDLREVFSELAAEKELAESLGLDFTPELTAQVAAQEQAEENNVEQEEFATAD